VPGDSPEEKRKKVSEGSNAHFKVPALVRSYSFLHGKIESWKVEGKGA
jgi:hypothetical protein